MTSSFLHDESGAASAWAIMWVIICIGLGGLALDGSNASRHKQMLRATADMAARAAMIVIESGGTEEQARQAAVATARANLPVQKNGDVVANPQNDVVIGHYEAGYTQLSSVGSKNAVSVSTRRNAAANSKVATFFLRLIGFTGWDVAAQGTAAINETQLCEHDGIFAHGKIHLSSQNYFREGYCVHAQEVVWMPQRNNWLARTSMSMPDLSACDDKCLNTANPGIESAMSEANYLLPGAGEIFDLTFTSFSGTGDPTLKDNFFADKTISGDLTVLSELGINTEGLTAGSTVSLNETEFESIASLPTGVIYDVQCSLHHGSGGVANEHQPGSVSDGDLDLHTDPDGTAATDLVILTNCKIDIQGNFRTSGALILTTDTGSNAAQAAISSSADAKIGTAGESCSNDERTAFLAKGRINFAAKLDANNVTFVTTDEVHLASKANDTSYHVRTMILTDSDVHVTSNHVFSGCPGNPPSFIDPEIRVIRFVHI